MARKIIPITERTHDEITGRKLLPKSELVHGGYYLGRCRHAEIARWSGDEQCFYHWREFVDYVYIETILYPTDETAQNWDVFDVVEELAAPRFVIPFDAHAEFNGRLEDLNEFHDLMWSKVR